MAPFKLVLGALVAGASATDLALTWKDCGDASTHTKISAVTPKSLTLGSTTTITGTGTLNEDVSDGSFEMKMTGIGGITLLDCKGDASTKKSCNLPLGVGTITFDGVAFPIKAGSQNILVDIQLAKSLPSSLLKTTTQVTAVTKSGDKIFCLDVMTAPSVEAALPPNYRMLFAQFKQEYSKTYASAAEEELRFAIFKDNVDFAHEANAANHSFRLGVTEWSDQTADEFGETHFGLNMPEKQWGNLSNLGVHEYKGEALAASVDWTTKGAVTSVKNQGQCGSCWSFSATGSLEGAWEIAGNKLVSLSEQQYVDCDKVDNGCGGGLMDNAFKYAEKNALCTEDSYSYTGVGGTCKKSACTVGIPQGGVTGYKDVASDSEQAMMSALAQQPVSIAIEADKRVFQLYKSGVLKSMCGASLDHGVLAVGYGTEAGSDYWLVKNSWGAAWGADGYVKLLRGKGGSGECGLLKQASYPVVTASAQSTLVV